MNPINEEKATMIPIISVFDTCSSITTGAIYDMMASPKQAKKTMIEYMTIGVNQDFGRNASGDLFLRSEK